MLYIEEFDIVENENLSLSHYSSSREELTSSIECVCYNYSVPSVMLPKIGIYHPTLLLTWSSDRKDIISYYRLPAPHVTG
jgi:hypothetical protein